jgi:two-component system chemotaxis response regulator CheB
VEERGGYSVPEEIKTEVAIAREDQPIEAGVLALGTPSMFSCPECHGVLLQIESENLARFRCHTGHAYSIQSLMADIEEGIEDALWSAIRAIEEQVLLMQQLAGHAHDSGAGASAENFSIQHILPDSERNWRGRQCCSRMKLTLKKWQRYDILFFNLTGRG